MASPSKAQITIKVTTPFLMYFACINKNYIPKAKFTRFPKPFLKLDRF